ncbi:MAG: sulfatase-like hydrolase/transferase [Bryobacterales bacterium]|nr:sulfatase-like hydrolase/transferase [Bryobacterales bacterium]
MSAIVLQKELSRRRALRALAGAGLAASARGAAEQRPNILFLYADDMGWGDASFNGRKEWPMPNLDRLAREGAVFDRWYTGSPLCAPSRACLLTGKYNIHNGVPNNTADLPETEVTIAEALRPLGYRTALFGKWHRGRLADGGFTHPLDQGFDETFGYLDARHAWEHFPKTLWRGRESVPVSGYSADLVANEAVRFLRSPRREPFFLYVPFIEPHFLVEAPEEDVAKFRGKFAEKDSNEPVNARYAAMLHRLDAAIGRILRALDEAGLAKNTLVVFTSDNGATFESGNRGASNYHDSNRPFRGQKRSLEEGGIREPAVVRWPGRVPAGTRSEEIIHMTDVFPTLLAAAGGKPDPAWKVDGMDMLAVWTGKAKAPERTLFWDFPIEGWNMRAAMRGDFKLLQIGDNRFLYNLKADPQERRTVGGEYPEIFKQLQKELESWLATAVAPAAVRVP